MLMEKKISIFWVAVIVLTAILVTFMATLYLSATLVVDEITPSVNAGENEILERVKALYALHYVGQGAVSGSDSEIKADSLSQFINLYIQSLGDTYGQYFTKEEYAAYVEENSGNYCGIGVTVRAEDEVVYNKNEYDDTPNPEKVKGGLLVMKVEESSGSFGVVNIGDIIVRVDGKSYAELGYDNFVNLIKGEEGTSVHFTVVRGAKYKTCETCGTYHLDMSEAYEQRLSVERKNLTTKSVYYSMENTTAYIKITGFDEKTAEQFALALMSAEEDGAKSYIFDVRDNPGGQLSSVLAVLSSVLSYDKKAEKTALIRVEDKLGNDNTGYNEYSVEYMDYYDIDPSDKAQNGTYANISEEYKSYAKRYNTLADQTSGVKSDEYRELAKRYEKLSGFSFEISPEAKIAVITNENTASAGELFTQALRDYGVSVTVGVKTFGKGSMQSFFYVSGRPGDTSLGMLKITANTYTSAYSESYNGIGIYPDHTVELDGEAASTNLWLLDKKNDAQYIYAYNLLNDIDLPLPDESQYNIVSE